MPQILDEIPAHKTNDEIIEITQKALPAVWGKPGDNVSKKYSFIPTHEFIRLANSAGWALFNAGEIKRNRRSLMKNPNSQETAKHFLAFRPNDDELQKRGLLDKLRVDDKIGSVSNAFPRLVFYNGHDRSTPAIFKMGIYEFVCSNTGIMSTEEWGTLKLRHMGINLQKLYEYFLAMLDSAYYILDTRTEMQKIDVTRDQAIEYAKDAIDLRWDGAKWSVDPAELIKPKRQEQSDLNVYNVYQTVQESVIRGGFKATNLEGNRKQRAERKQNKIKNIFVDKEINEGLWSKTLDWVGNMGYQLPPPPVIDIDVRNHKN